MAWHGGVIMDMSPPWSPNINFRKKIQKIQKKIKFQKKKKKNFKILIFQNKINLK
jgi:hypothetical protein